jgi:hypothetical protein
LRVEKIFASICWGYGKLKREIVMFDMDALFFRTLAIMLNPRKFVNLDLRICFSGPTAVLSRGCG